MKTFNVFSRIILILLFGLISCNTGSDQLLQPVLGTRSVAIIEKKGLKFKDLNKNGKLDRYEDWRLSAEERSLDLLSKMSLEEKVGFMLISTTRLKNEQSFRIPDGSNAPVTSDFYEEDLVQTENIFTNKPLPVPMMTAAGTTKGVTQFHLRHFILRANVSARTIAEWSNRLQELCESQPLGIPAIVASNPRNNVTSSASLGTSVSGTAFSLWPGELGLSAMRDLELTREFADIARQEWKAVGLRKGYMYMADLSTEPRWQRIDGTFGENAEWVSKMIREIVIGFQGEKLNPESVALTTKHFPGGGAGKEGQDPHFEWGKYEVFPGDKIEDNLLPFIAAIEAGTSAIMPYYSLPLGTQYEEIAYAYNKSVIHELLRVRLGFKGIINSDTGPIEMMPWGVEELSVKERYKKSLEAGVNLYSGTADPAMLLETVRSGMVDIALIDSSVVRLLKEKFVLGLFENPYVDEDAAEQIAGNEKFQERANLAHRKSIVLLRNESGALPLKPGTKVYFETYAKRYGSEGSGPGVVFSTDDKTLTVRFVSKPEQADVILLWIKPMAQSLFGSTGAPLDIRLSKCAVDVAYVNRLAAKKPTVLVMNYTNPWVIGEIYNEKTLKNYAGVLATFGTTADALIDIVTGKFNPAGKMPFSTPVSMDAVLKQKEDVAGFQEEGGYALFNFDEGLTYK